MTMAESNERRVLRIGTRKSLLALTQTHIVADAIRSKSGQQDLKIEIVEILSQADKMLETPLSQIPGRGVFTKELERALVDKTVDIAVHSLKDLPTVLPEGLQICAVSEREDPSDALVLPIQSDQHGVKSITDLRPNSKIGTSSLRRAAQIRRLLPQAEIVDIRGNIQTRLNKLDSNQYDALILATSGLKRLGIQERIVQVLPADMMMHAVGQGALAVECRSDDEWTINLLQKTVHHHETHCFCEAERSLLRELEGGCSVPIGVRTYVTTDNDEGKPTLVLRGGVFSIGPNPAATPTATTTTPRAVVDEVRGEMSVEGAIELGKQLAEKLKQKGAQAILEEIKKNKEQHPQAQQQPLQQQ
eukprot:GEZU01025555.1.p1 GENE.GEZU01025555.1~~GEZU01025555.1.p1  ORF type:complete len:382 (+),score=98.65 GEZU01025555.1:69-1148(+)